MSEEKYCPLRSSTLDRTWRWCQREKCAWWMRYGEKGVVVKEGCAIGFIASQGLPILHKK